MKPISKLFIVISFFPEGIELNAKNKISEDQAL